MMDCNKISPNGDKKCYARGKKISNFTNYTSPVEHEDWTWIQGQLSPEGTQIYLAELQFVPEPELD